MTGDDMENIRMELEKLVKLYYGAEIITDEDRRQSVRFG